MLRLLITSDDQQASSITTQPQQKALSNELLAAQPCKGEGKGSQLVPFSSLPHSCIPNQLFNPPPKKPAACLAARCSAEHHSVVQGGIYNSKKTPKKPTHKVPNVGLQEQRHNRQPWAGCARWESQKMGNRSEQHTAEGLCFTQKHPTKVMVFFLLNWHLMAFKRPQQQIEKEKKKLLGKSECSKE